MILPQRKYIVYLFNSEVATFCFHFCIHICKAKGTLSVYDKHWIFAPRSKKSTTIKKIHFSETHYYWKYTFEKYRLDVCTAIKETDHHHSTAIQAVAIVTSQIYHLQVKCKKIFQIYFKTYFAEDFFTSGGQFRAINWVKLHLDGHVCIVVN